MSTLSALFRPLTFDDAAHIPALSVCPSRSCEYTFANAMMWRHHYHTEIACVEDIVCMRFGGEEDPHYLAPTGDFFKGVQFLKTLCRESGKPIEVFGYEKEDIARLSCEMTVLSCEEFPDDFDYIYRVSDLVALSGNRFHGKRNHISAFSRKYTWKYESLCDENVQDFHDLADSWYNSRQDTDEDDALKDENAAIHELLHHRNELQLVGGLIRVDNTPVAFTFGAELCADTFDTLVEKALPEYGGAYTVINREFAARELGGYTFVNRENDEGIEGLRRAKQSYHPAVMVKKTLCTITE